MFSLQLLWSIRLTRHALKRGFYDFTTEDYRYSQLRKMIPRWFMEIIHFFAVAIPQPLLLLFLTLPMQNVLLLPPTELSSGMIPSLHLPYSSLVHLLPMNLRGNTPPTTPVLNISDVLFFLVGLGLLYIEGKADGEMYEYQTSKHAALESSSPADKKDMVDPSKMVRYNDQVSQFQDDQKKSQDTQVDHEQLSNRWKGQPRPTSYPRKYHPGFPTKGLFRWSRHANFAAEQLFWLNQAFFVVCAGESSGVTRAGWVGGSVFGPAFALSILFCASTFLTEWITQSKSEYSTVLLTKVIRHTNNTNF
ncbi:hypothetical protein TREMEDRAFT_60721 [Tremella mesenterica DSM 1558]|uniref:uncharacterized protein n=1 Tax=Tremella mesenterica (strain ATCC 24925 / CBS 8224 / DSM 1558 / NBRC 9311 / NRRL Y-6157 / RJB 2259-6 / UBC 559-6) TaxID=578456 RepID=UPI0003F48ED8|nr:uncharacterized protein TREMEDRAFT_60721 [Tremella mesenterica DSM 1558]EIW71803.1 hypothetical protein TREMEDRAFT_60721 [Tremella mesenterica DSM 1558]